MNLHALVRPLVSRVNPDQPIVILHCAGQAMGAAYTPVPVYLPAVCVMAQPQPVPDAALQLLIQERAASVWQDFYVTGQWRGLERATENGGDLVYWDGYEWLVDQILERWSPTAGWTKIRCVLQRVCPLPEIGATQPPPED